MKITEQELTLRGVADNTRARHALRSRHELFSDSLDLFKNELDHGGVVAVLAFTQSVPLLSANYEWFCADHQAGGHACDQVRFVGTPLNLRPSIDEHLRQLAKKYYYAQCGHFYRGRLRASDIVGYVETLHSLGFECEYSWRLFQEGIYPIDATQAHLDRLSDRPPNLNDITARGKTLDNLTILVLAENSD